MRGASCESIIRWGRGWKRRGMKRLTPRVVIDSLRVGWMSNILETVNSWLVVVHVAGTLHGVERSQQGIPWANRPNFTGSDVSIAARVSSFTFKSTTELNVCKHIQRRTQATQTHTQSSQPGPGRWEDSSRHYWPSLPAVYFPRVDNKRRQVITTTSRFGRIRRRRHSETFWVRWEEASNWSVWKEWN